LLADPWPLAVTTARVERDGQRDVAMMLAAELGAPFIERHGRGVERLLDDEGLASLIYVNEEGVKWCDGADGRFFWHPNMAFVRLRSALKCGLGDPLVRAAGVTPGDRVLDATLGLGADAIVLADAVGESGEVIGVEASPVIAALVRHGLATYAHKSSAVLDRIRVVVGDHRALLADAAFIGPGFAAICFDPMFEHTVARSNGLEGVRRLACYDRLAPETIRAARALVSKAVVVKGRRDEDWLAALGPAEVVAGRHNRVAYGVFPPL
jgi:hypothetical protein